MEDNPTFAGIGSTAYFILKDDLQPDTNTPKEGKQWHKVDLSAPVQFSQTRSESQSSTEAQPKGFRQTFTMIGERRGNWLYRPPRPPIPSPSPAHKKKFKAEQKRRRMAFSS